MFLWFLCFYSFTEIHIFIFHKHFLPNQVQKKIPPVLEGWQILAP